MNIWYCINLSMSILMIVFPVTVSLLWQNLPYEVKVGRHQKKIILIRVSFFLTIISWIMYLLLDWSS